MVPLGCTGLLTDERCRLQEVQVVLHSGIGGVIDVPEHVGRVNLIGVVGSRPLGAVVKPEADLHDEDRGDDPAGDGSYGLIDPPGYGPNPAVDFPRLPACGIRCEGDGSVAGAGRPSIVRKIPIGIRRPYVVYREELAPR